MTCLEKFKAEHSGKFVNLNDALSLSCPHDYCIMYKPTWCQCIPSICAKCWDREIVKPDIELKHRDGHYEAYVDGKFYCSGDTLMEIHKELTEGGFYDM